MNCCFRTNAQEFLTINVNEWLKKMIEQYKVLCKSEPSTEQIEAWKDCNIKMKPFLWQCVGYHCELVFEYELPREGGRRPDVLVFSGNTVLVLEFKRKDKIIRADLDQVSSYARDIQCYHNGSYQLVIIPVLIPTLTSGKSKDFDDVIACSPDVLFNTLENKLSKEGTIDVEKWLESKYCPLPSIIDAAKTIYNNETLPYIRKANSAGIPKAVSLLKEIASNANQNNERVLALVTGVPGSGKTLLGLDFVHQSENSIFLSGNGPLVEVLQYALKSKTFVAPLRNFVKEYGVNCKGIPVEHIVVFDEAQRAWDREHVYEKYLVNKSEPELIISIADKLPQWAMLVGLIGEGQEIHNGEEAGIEQWKLAIQNSNEQWKIICPPKLSKLFNECCKTFSEECLDLNISLRSHMADDVSQWANALLNGEIEEALTLANNIHNQGFNMYITRDLMRARSYCVHRYENISTKRYGLIASSKSYILPRYGITNDYNSTKKIALGPWFNEGVENLLSCCQLNSVVTEFQCQGLELDMPILCWGEDMLWKDKGWAKYNKASKCKDPNRLRINSYRVLLTRGRDGFIIYLPDDKLLDATYKTLLNAGVRCI